jgi:hypothetical protein
MIVGHVVFVVLAGPAWDAVRNRTRETERDSGSESMLWKGVDYMAEVWGILVFLTLGHVRWLTGQMHFVYIYEHLTIWSLSSPFRTIGPTLMPRPEVSL